MRARSHLTGFDRACARDTFRAQYENGASIRAIAASAGRSYANVHKLLLEAGTQLRTRGGTRAETPQADR